MALASRKRVMYDEPSVTEARGKFNSWNPRLRTGGVPTTLPRYASGTRVDVSAMRTIVGKDLPMSGTQSNHRIVHNFHVRRMLGGSTADMGQGCTVWLKKSGKHDPITQMIGTAPNNALSLMATHIVNHNLAEMTFNSKDKRIPDVEWVSDNYEFDGILYTDKMHTSFRNGDRVVGVDRANPYGRCRNIWNNDVQGMDYLWLLVKYVKMGRSITYNPISYENTFDTFHAFRPDGEPLPYPGYLVQIVPHTTRTPYVARSDLETVIQDDDGVEKKLHGYAVRVGIVKKYDKQGSSVDFSGAVRSATSLEACPALEVYVGVCTY